MRLSRLLLLAGILITAACDKSKDTPLDNDQIIPETAQKLDKSETANCYIVSDSGTYSFMAVKGNSSELVGEVASVQVLWESFGYSLIPKEGDLIRSLIYESDRIYFKTSDPFTRGNAVIAAKDAGGTILWSWHIWMTDKPKSQLYPNNVGAMMDRNLGATSPDRGHVLSLGLLYQWGRKDPFLNSMHIDRPTMAQSTLIWPEAVKSDASTGTIDFSIKNPTTFILRAKRSDWLFTEDHSRWQSKKTIYDPCPPGWRVPDGGENGFWVRAGLSGNTFVVDVPYDAENLGAALSLGNSETAWYPYAGYYYDNFYGLTNVGSSGYYWSSTGEGDGAYCLQMSHTSALPYAHDSQATGMSVRCMR